MAQNEQTTEEHSTLGINHGSTVLIRSASSARNGARQAFPVEMTA